MNKLEIVVPCYNEEDILEYTINELQIVLDIMVEDSLISESSGICFINDIWLTPYDIFPVGTYEDTLR